MSKTDIKFQKGERVQLLGNYKIPICATIIRKGHKNYYVINIDGHDNNVEWNIKRLKKMEG